MSDLSRSSPFPFLAYTDGFFFTYDLPHAPKCTSADRLHSKFVVQPIPLGVLCKDLRNKGANADTSTLRVLSQHIVKLSRDSHTSHDRLFGQLWFGSLFYFV